MHRGISSLATLAAVIVPGLAQAQTPTQRFEPGETIAWPAASQLGPMRHPVAGRFIDPGQTDIAFLANGVPTLIACPAGQGVTATIATVSGETINDLCLVPASSSGGCDDLATVGSGGLRLRSFSRGLSNFTWTSLSGNANWLGAKQVRAGNLDGSGTLDYAGVGSTGTFLVFRFNGAAQAPRFSVPNSILDVQLCEWDGDAASELAVLTTAGVSIYESSGTLLASYSNPGNGGGAIAAVRVAGSATQVLEWLSLNNGAHPSLYELVPGAPSPALLVADMGADYRRMVAADLPPAYSLMPDGGSDLLLAALDNCAPLLMVQNTSGARFTHVNSGLVDPVPASCFHFTQLSLLHDTLAAPQDPLFADFSGDGMPDVLIGIGLAQVPPGESGTRLQWLHCTNAGSGQQASNSTSAVFLESAVADPTGPGGTRRMYLEINTDKNALPLGTMTQNTNCLDVNVWAEGATAQGQPLIQAVAIERLIIPIGTNSQVYFYFDLPEDSACFDPNLLYWVQVKYAHADNLTLPTSLTAAGATCTSLITTERALLSSLWVMGDSYKIDSLLPSEASSCVWQRLDLPSVTDCYPSTVFMRGPGHAKRTGIRRDSVGTIQLPGPLHETSSYPDPFPSAPEWDY